MAEAVAEVTELTLTLEEEIKLALEQKYMREGKVPDLESVEQYVKQYKPGSDWVEENVWIQAWFREVGFTNNPDPQLSTKQYLLAKILLSTTDNRSLRTKLKAVGVTQADYNRWLKDKKFINFIRGQTQQNFKNADIHADGGLVRMLETGDDLNAIKYYNEITGRHVQAEAINIQVVLATVMEILVTYVSPDILKKVASELESRVFSTIEVQSRPVGVTDKTRFQLENMT